MQRLSSLVLTTSVAIAAALLLAAGAAAWTWPVDGLVLRPFLFDAADPLVPGQHRGIDVAAPSGAVVRAPAAGEVTFVGSVAANGLSVTIRTADAYAVTLTHLGSAAVKKGAVLAEGDAVGAVGPSGDAEVDGPYVHLGVRAVDEPDGYRDPVALLPPRLAPPSPPAAAAESPARTV